MNIKNKATSTIIIMTCVATLQANAMMSSYLATLAGDTFLAASGCSMIAKKEMTMENQLKLIDAGITLSQISQMKTDANRIKHYLPILIPLGVVLSIGGRLGMIRNSLIKGLLLAPLSAPLNSMLIGTGYCAHLYCAPDAGIAAKTCDTGLDLVKRLSNEGRK